MVDSVEAVVLRRNYNRNHLSLCARKRSRAPHEMGVQEVMMVERSWVERMDGEDVIQRPVGSTQFVVDPSQRSARILIRDDVDRRGCRLSGLVVQFTSLDWRKAELRRGFAAGQAVAAK